MRSQGAVSTQSVVDGWMDAVAAEYGVGSDAAILTRLAPLVTEVVESATDQPTAALIEIGYQIAQSNHGLDFTMRCLQLLAASGGAELSDRLDTRHVAVLVAEGWNSGTLGRLHLTDDQLTPMPVFLHLLRRRHLRAHAGVDQPARRMVLVVVQLGEVDAGGGMQADVLRAATIRAVRSVWSAAYPIGQGTNGNLVVMVDRDDELHARVSRVQRLLVDDAALHVTRVHLWIEPLSSAAIHLEPHLVSLVGPIEMAAGLQGLS